MSSRESGSGYTGDELLPWMQRVRQLLEKAGQPYALIGGVAVMHYGVRARTRDLDFLILGTRDRIVDLALADGLSVEEKSSWHTRLWSETKAFYADILEADASLHIEAIRDARHVEIASVPFPIVSPEMLIALKVIAGRPRDLRDVEDIVEQQGSIDADRVNELLEPLGLSFDPGP